MKLTDDLQSPKAIYAKGLLFLIAGLLAAGLIVLENPKPTTVLLLAVTVWAFCRCYYFVFYVIEKYVDGSYRFAGVGSFLAYLLKKRK